METSKENLRGTASTLTCQITDIAEQMSLSWSGLEGLSPEDYTATEGTFNAGTFSQTGTLALESGAVIADRTYTCTIASTRFPESTPKVLDVYLNVYGMVKYSVT